MKLVINGVFYKYDDTVVVCRVTGEHYIADCGVFEREENLDDGYEKDQNQSVTVEGVAYWYLKEDPAYTERMVMISDISELMFQEDSTIFN